MSQYLGQQLIHVINTISNLKQLSFSNLIHPQMYVCELDKIFATFDVCAVKL